MADVVLKGPGPRDVTICGVTAVQIPKPGGGMKLFPLSGSVAAEDVELLDASRIAQTIPDTQQIVLRAKEGGSVEFPSIPRSTFKFTGGDFASGRLDITQSQQNSVTVDWGDGSPSEVFVALSESRTHNGYQASVTYTASLYIVNGAEVTLRLCRFNGLTDVVLGEGITELNGNVFTDKIKTIRFPSSLVSIKNSAFYNCAELTDVHIGSVISWLSIEFGNAASNPLNKGATLYENNVAVEHLVIPSCITKIQKCSFTNYLGIKSVIFHGNVQNIGDEAFSACTNLEQITLESGIESIGRSAFANIGIKTVTVPDSVTNIGAAAFYYCRNLTTINLGRGVKTIPRMFAYASGITAIIIPEGVQSIGESAFEACRDLETVEISSTVTELDEYAFYFCANVMVVTVKAVHPPSLAGVTSIGFNASCIFYVPAGSVEAYKAAQYWSERAAYIQAIPGT